ncbi:hypothetical protein BDV96DRAFT_606608 [Lophiotrema nucula]|uniref:BHLH domain-containing protein n=1 Tax=Lophiotrema nucula TaxID=690887 RepID=A0A6A5YJY2_9PLEO|nr:hypothetical protein BDV96DRAFT_606608 [Lophiotrema nucula]
MDRDPNPFGCMMYTFSGFGEDGSPTQYTHGGPSLLSETENQSLADFFSNTDPFLSEAPAFPVPDFKDGLDDFNWPFVPPATIHRVSTTIPDQAQLHNHFSAEHAFPPDPLSASHLTNTQDDLQAASTLFNNAHGSHMGFGRSYSMPGIPTSSNGMLNGHAHSHVPATQNIPMVPTPGGFMNEQLAAMLPNHSENGSVDATLAATFTQVHQGHVRVPELEKPRPQLKRAFTYGTDENFGRSRYAPPSPLPTEEDVVERMLSVIPPPIKQENPKRKGSTAHGDFPPAPVGYQSDGEGHSEDEASDEDGNRPVKKRRRSGKAQNSPRKSVSGARGKDVRKTSLDAGKKKRGSTAGQKRENLTEAQKRSNHILSEQKRRNLIRRGFDDLHELVPEIRNGGLSKSGILMEAVNFLEKIIEDNRQFMRLADLTDD